MSTAAFLTTEKTAYENFALIAQGARTTKTHAHLTFYFTLSTLASIALIFFISKINLRSGVLTCLLCAEWMLLLHTQIKKEAVKAALIYRDVFAMLEESYTYKSSRIFDAVQIAIQENNLQTINDIFPRVKELVDLYDTVEITKGNSLFMLDCIIYRALKALALQILAQEKPLVCSSEFKKLRSVCQEFVQGAGLDTQIDATALRQRYFLWMVPNCVGRKVEKFQLSDFT